MEVSSQNDEQAMQKESDSSRAVGVHTQTRKRKGSLRKTALLGPGKVFLEKRIPNASPPKPKSPSKNEKRSNKGGYNSQNTLSGSSSSGSLSLNPEFSGRPQQHQRKTLLSPLSSSLDLYNSTTDDDDDVLLPIPGSFQRSTSPTSATSSESSIQKTTQSKERRSSVETALEAPLPVSQVLLSSVSHTEEWDYAATERWGWIILFSTWIVFVVGMGSCFDVWSWAWDVGETPYAAPELEDDPTLPIVGYYPALIVLTAVMCWVWVIVAWVGMKYFKHAKIQGDDT